MTFNRKWLQNFKNKEGPKVTFGDNSQGTVKGFGDIVTREFILTKVYYVEGLKHNLISISQICDKGFNVNCSKLECIVKDKKGNPIINGKRKGNLYSLNLDLVLESNGICLLTYSQSDSGWLWHKRLGHLNFKNISKLQSLNLVRGLPKASFKKDRLCRACQCGKQKKASFKAINLLKTSKPLELLHMDLFGPIRTRSFGGKKYSLVVVDDFTRFTWILLMESKDETLYLLTRLINKIQNQKNSKVIKIRSDHGTEFENTGVEEFCNQQGIEHNFSAPRTPQQNGVAERKNRTICEAARTMLSEYNLPKHFWGEAVNTAVYVQNKTLINKFHNKTPYELWNGRVPTISYFHIFGTKCYIHNNGRDNLDKFAPKSDEGIFLGYSSTSKAYRVYNKNRLVIEESIHVDFDESGEHNDHNLCNVDSNLENAPENTPIPSLRLNPETSNMNYLPYLNSSSDSGAPTNHYRGLDSGKNSQQESQVNHNPNNSDTQQATSSNTQESPQQPITKYRQWYSSQYHCQHSC